MKVSNLFSVVSIFILVCPTVFADSSAVKSVTGLNQLNSSLDSAAPLKFKCGNMKNQSGGEIGGGELEVDGSSVILFIHPDEPGVDPYQYTLTPDPSVSTRLLYKQYVQQGEGTNGYVVDFLPNKNGISKVTLIQGNAILENAYFASCTPVTP